MTTNTSKTAAQKLAEKKADEKMALIEANRSIWDKLCFTAPEFIKDFNNGTYRGKSIAPMYVFKRLTETFGPNGQGWGWEILDKDRIAVPNGDVNIYVTIQGWYKVDGEVYKTSPQIAGEKLAYTTSKGRFIFDDEAYKKAITDGATKCFTYLGSSADVHLGQHDDVKMSQQIAAYTTASEESLKLARQRKREADIAALVESGELSEGAAEMLTNAEELEGEALEQAKAGERADAEKLAKARAKARAKSVEAQAETVEAPADFKKLVGNVGNDISRLNKAKDYAASQYEGAVLAAAIKFVDDVISYIQTHG